MCLVLHCSGVYNAAGKIEHSPTPRCSPHLPPFPHLRSHSRARRSYQSKAPRVKLLFAFHAKRINRTGYIRSFKMVQLTAFFAILALSSPLALSHPLLRRQLSGDPLLQNGLQAQKLNSAFQGLKASDNCTSAPHLLPFVPCFNSHATL